jgi:5'-methylthioadenosine phosphorylase
MAVVNISLINDYDSGLHADVEPVNAQQVLQVFEKNAKRIRQVVLDMIGAMPADLDSMGAREALRFTRGDGHAQSDDDVRIFETEF